MRRGTARRYDHAQLVHAQWMHVAMLGMRLWVVRVATNDNVADLPSRQDLWQLRASGAVEWEHRMAAFLPFGRNLGDSSREMALRAHWLLSA